MSSLHLTTRYTGLHIDKQKKKHFIQTTLEGNAEEKGARGSSINGCTQSRDWYGSTEHTEDLSQQSILVEMAQHDDNDSFKLAMNNFCIYDFFMSVLKRKMWRKK